MNEKLQDLTIQATQFFSPVSDRDKWVEKIVELLIADSTQALKESAQANQNDSITVENVNSFLHERYLTQK